MPLQQQLVDALVALTAGADVECFNGQQGLPCAGAPYDFATYVYNGVTYNLNTYALPPFSLSCEEFDRRCCYCCCCAPRKVC